MQRLLRVQFGLLALSTGGLIAAGEQAIALGVAWGGIIAIANSLLLARSVMRAGRAALKGGKAGMAQLYWGFLARFALLLAGLGAGLLHWGMSGLAIIAGYAVVSLGATFTKRLT